MSLSIIIRIAVTTDVAGLRHLEEEVFVESDGLLTRGAFYYHVRSKNLLLVAENDTSEENRCVGYILVLFRRSKARIYSLAVVNEFRGRGIAKELLTRVINIVSSMGCAKISLEVRETNQKAILLYSKYGFSKEKRLPGYYGPGSNGLRMCMKFMDGAAESSSCIGNMY